MEFDRREAESNGDQQQTDRYELIFRNERLFLLKNVYVGDIFTISLMLFVGNSREMRDACIPYASVTKMHRTLKCTDGIRQQNNLNLLHQGEIVKRKWRKCDALSDLLNGRVIFRVSLFVDALCSTASKELFQ